MSTAKATYTRSKAGEPNLDFGQVDTLRKAITTEVFHYLNLPNDGWFSRLLERPFRIPASRFVHLAAQFDGHVDREGFGSAARWILPRFIHPPRVTGEATIPPEGPLLILANHPGTFDGLAVAAHLPRDDFKTIARGMPFLRGLPSTSKYLIFSNRDIHVKMTAARAAIRQLNNGGVLLLFPSGTMDPDPAGLAGAGEALETWSASMDLLLRREPEAQVQIAALGGFLAPENLNHPLARFRKTALERQIAAEIIQVLRQILFGQIFSTLPRILFTPPVSAKDLPTNLDGSFLPGIRIIARQALLQVSGA